MARGGSLLINAKPATNRLADAPLDGMNPVRAVGNSRGADVLACRQKIIDSNRQQRTEWSFKRVTVDVHRVTQTRCAGMQIDAIGTDAYAVEKILRAGKPGARFDVDMLFQNREFGSDAPAFAIIGLLGKSIGRTENIAAQSQAAIAISPS
jgi:hypothetical protein